jgi:PhnB protein
MKGITAYLQVTNTGDSIAWYERVFGASEIRARLVAPDGTCMNAEIEIEGTRLMLADEMPNIGSTSPRTLSGTSVVLNLLVSNADETFERALGNGAEEIYPLVFEKSLMRRWLRHFTRCSKIKRGQKWTASQPCMRTS